MYAFRLKPNKMKFNAFRNIFEALVNTDGISL